VYCMQHFQQPRASAPVCSRRAVILRTVLLARTFPIRISNLSRTGGWMHA
jgi:hypothetical protein